MTLEVTSIGNLFSSKSRNAPFALVAGDDVTEKPSRVS